MKKIKLNKFILLPLLIVVGAILYQTLIKNRDFYYVGTVEATMVDISSRVASVIANFPAQEGHKVDKGDILIELACEDIKNSFALFNNDFERAKKLFASGSLSKENYDHITSKKTEAQIKKDWCTIKSHLNAKVLNTFREAGEYVNPGTRLLTLADLSTVWATIYVPQEIHSRLKTGMKAEGFIPELKMKKFSGEISHLSDVAEFTPKNVQTRDERTRLIFAVKIKFLNPDETLKPGMAIEVQLKDI